MKYRMHKNWNPVRDSIQMTRRDIESQVFSDYINYVRNYFNKYNIKPSWPLDIDNFLKEMWNVDVVYEPIKQEKEDSTVLGILNITNNKIYVDDKNSFSEENINFTLAHEAGHLSLHSPFFKAQPRKHLCLTSKTDRKTEISHVRREWQANKYAAALLMPKSEIISCLNNMGIAKGEIIRMPVELGKYAPVFQQMFGVSRQALEIRLSDMAVPFKDAVYQIER